MIFHPRFFRLIASIILLVSALVTAFGQTPNYKFVYIERLATEKWGGSRDMAVTSDGSMYVMGTAPGNDLPTLGPQITDAKGIKPDAFGPSYLQKYDSEGNLLYASYVNGCNGQRIRVVDDENIYITGHFADDDCSTPGAYRVENPQGGAFLTKLNLREHKIVYSLAIGGPGGGTEAFGLGVTPSGEPVLAGYTESGGFPTTEGAIQRTFRASTPFGESGWVAKFSSDGSHLTASTYLGSGTESTMIRGIAVDRSGAVVAVGWTKAKDFPTTTAFGTTSDDYPQMAFITKLSRDLEKIVFSDRLNGGSANCVTIDPADSVYVSGGGYEGLPTTPGVYQPKAKGKDENVFITALNADGSLRFSTFLGGKGVSLVGQIVVDTGGRIYIVGSTRGVGFPVTKNAYQSNYEGGLKRLDLGETFKTLTYDHPPDDGFLSILSPKADALLYSTYLGGTDLDSIDSVGIDSKGNVYIQGSAQSKRFPQINPKTKVERGDSIYLYFLGKLVP